MGLRKSLPIYVVPEQTDVVVCVSFSVNHHRFGYGIFLENYHTKALYINKCFKMRIAAVRETCHIIHHLALHESRLLRWTALCCIQLIEH